VSIFNDKVDSLKQLLSRVPNVGNKVKEQLMQWNPLRKSDIKNVERPSLISEATDILEVSTSKLTKYYDELSDKVMQSENFNSVCERGKIVVSLPKEYFDQLMSSCDNKETGNSEKDKLESAIIELKKKDKVGIAGEIVATTGGAISGIAASGAIASSAGATTLLGSTTLASIGGGVFVVSTPLGWVVGSALVAGSVGYGIAKLIRSGSKQDQERKNIVERLRKRLDALDDKAASNTVIEELRKLLPIAVGSNLVRESQADRMLELIDKNKLNPELALRRVQALQVQIQFHEIV